MKQGIVSLSVALTLGACGFLDDKSPSTLSFALTGPEPVQVEVIYSTQFNAGVDEFGVTQLTVFQSDTVIQTLPVNSSFDIRVDRRWFVQVRPVDVAEATFQVQVSVDGRSLIDESGFVEQIEPWRYAYLFNQPVTRVIDTQF